DRQHLPAELLNLRIAFLHLAEVLAASQSSEMAEEDQDERFGVEVGEARGRAVEALESAIRDAITQARHSHASTTTYPSLNWPSSLSVSAGDSVRDWARFVVGMPTVADGSILEIGERCQLADRAMRWRRWSLNCATASKKKTPAIAAQITAKVN